MKRYVQEVATSLLLCCVVWYNRRRRLGLLTSVEGPRYAKGHELFRSRWSSVGKLTSCTDFRLFPAGERVDSYCGLVWHKVLAIFLHILLCQRVFILLGAFAKLRKLRYTYIACLVFLQVISVVIAQWLMVRCFWVWSSVSWVHCVQILAHFPLLSVPNISARGSLRRYF